MATKKKDKAAAEKAETKKGGKKELTAEEKKVSDPTANSAISSTWAVATLQRPSP